MRCDGVRVDHEKVCLQSQDRCTRTRTHIATQRMHKLTGPLLHGLCQLPSFAKLVNVIGFSIAVYKRGDIVSNSIKQSGHWEPNVLAPYMTPSTVYVDVGANIGWHSFSVAQTHQVVAFEPFERNRKLFNATRCVNPRLAKNIHLYEFGLSNHSQNCHLYQDPNVNVGDTHSVCEPHPVRADSRLGEAHLYRLDDVAPQRLIDVEKVMKVDVEAHELEMIQGARRFLTRGNPPKAMVIEVMHLRDPARRARFFQTLEEYGYRPAHKVDSRSVDVIFVPKS